MNFKDHPGNPKSENSTLQKYYYISLCHFFIKMILHPVIALLPKFEISSCNQLVSVEIYF